MTPAEAYATHLESRIWQMLGEEQAPPWYGIAHRATAGGEMISGCLGGDTEEEYLAALPDVAAILGGAFALVTVRRDGQWLVPVGHA